MGRCVAGQTKTFGIELGSVANAGKFQVNPTLDAADFRISINGGSFTALTNTPTVSPSGGAQVVVVLAAAETTSAGAGGRIHLRCSDSSGNEWQDVAVEIEVFATAEDTLVATVTNLTNAPANGDLTATMKASVTTAATAATPTVTAGTVTDKSGYSLSSAGIQAIWDALTSALTAAGSIGKLLVDNVNATISSRSSHTAANVRTEMDSNSTQLAKLGTPAGASLAADVAAVKADTDNLPASPAATSDIPSASSVANAVWASGTRTLTSYGTLIADIWAYVTRTLTSSGSGGATAQEVWEYGTRTLTSAAPPTAVQIRQEMDSNSTQLASIKSDTAATLLDTGTDGVVVASGSKAGYSLASNQSSVTIGTVDALGTQAKADVNAEVVDALNVDTYAEPTSTPAATSSLAAKIRWLFKLSRNKIIQDGSEQSLYADNGTTVDNTAPVSDDGSEMMRGEWS